MTENKGTQRTDTKPLMMTGTGILALILLTGCSTATDPASSPADGGPGTTQSATTEPSPATGDDKANDEGSSQSPTSGTTTAVAGDDPVFAAIDALHAQHSDALIVEIDQDDNDTVYEIEAVVGDRILDVDVTTDGALTEDGNTDDDDDDIRKAREATVTAEEAARAALEGRDGSTIDSLSLDDDDNTLQWEVELDNEQGDDDVDLRVNATTGAVSAGN